MTSPSPEVAPYAQMLEVVGPLPRPWRMAAVRLMRDLARAQASTLPADPTRVGGVDASTVETTRVRAIGNGGVAAAAGGTDPPPATPHTDGDAA